MQLQCDTESEEEMRRSLSYMMSNKNNRVSVPMEINRLLKSKLRKLNKKKSPNGENTVELSFDNESLRSPQNIRQCRNVNNSIDFTMRMPDEEIRVAP